MEKRVLRGYPRISTEIAGVDFIGGEKWKSRIFLKSGPPPRLIRRYLVEFEFSMKIYFDSRINLHGYHTKIKLKSTGRDHFEKGYFNVILFCIFFKSGAIF